jgi:hypothetical protein
MDLKAELIPNPKILLHEYNIIGNFILVNHSIIDNIINQINNGIYIFGLYPQTYRSLYLQSIDKSQIDNVSKLLQKYPTLIFYLINGNLCGTSKRLAWNGNIDQDKKTKKWIKNVNREIDVLLQLKGSLIISAGIYRYNKELGITSSIKSLSNLNPNIDIYIMNGVEYYDNIVCTLEDLKLYFNKCNNYKLTNINICLNIVNFFVSGIYDFRKKTQIDTFFNKIDELQLNPKLVILEDSVCDFNEQHRQITKIKHGCIWRKANLDYFIQLCLQRHIYILFSNNI